jgi:PadR family transcriptional regulator PadR
MKTRYDLFPGALELMILRSLERSSMHGYALATYIKQRSGDLLQVEEGSLYPALQRLLKASLVTARWELSPNSRQVRTYSLTTNGLKHLEKQTVRLDKMLEGVQLVLAKES